MMIVLCGKNNGMIYGEKRQRYTLERKRLQEVARVYLYAPKEESLVPIKNIKATRRSVRNLPNIEIANWIAEQKRARQKMRQRKTISQQDLSISGVYLKIYSMEKILLLKVSYCNVIVAHNKIRPIDLKSFYRS